MPYYPEQSSTSELLAPPPRRRNVLVSLILRFFFFVGQTIKVIFFTALVFAIAGAASFLLVQKHIRGTEIPMPNVTGRTVDDATKMLWDKKLDLSVQIEAFETSELVAEGEIVSQFPQPGNNVKAGTVVRVRVSMGSTLLACPDVRGKNYLEAGVALRNANLDEGVKSFLHSSEFKKDVVMAQDPPPNAGVERRSAVNLLVSMGPEVSRSPMPNLIDLTPTEAVDKLKPLGLSITSQSEGPSPGRDNGLIFEQSPAAGAFVSPGDAVTVTVVRNEPGTANDE
jgi:eukaryotic-like serine/threonine-protein kinase